MKHCFFLVLLLTGGILSSSAQTHRPTIGVTDLTGQGVDQASTAIISDRLRTELFKQGGFTVLERNAMQDVLKEQGFQQAACSSDACAVEMGNLLGVRFMIVGSVGKLGRLFTLNIRMIDVSSAKIVFSENVDCDCPIETVLTGSVVSITKKITQSVKGEASTKQPAGSLGAIRRNGIAGENGEDTPSGKTRDRHGIMLKVSLGALTIGAAAAGVVFNAQMQDKIDENAQLKADYLALGSDARYAEFSEKIAANAESAKSLQTKRNAGYIVAGLCAAGLTLTFVF